MGGGEAGGRWDVVIAGGGPVGLALAAELGWRNVRCLLVERGDGSASQPKMDMVGVRTMEFCRRWDIVGEVEACPYPRDRPQDIIYLETLAAPELARDPFPSMADEAVPPQSPQKRERCPQNMFDPILKHCAQSFASVTLRYGTEVAGFQLTEDGGVTVELKAGAQRSHVSAAYLAACDGGASSLRETLGIAMSGQGVLTYTVNILFRSDSFSRLGGIAPGYRYIFIENGRIWATIVAIDGRSTYRMSVVGDGEPRTLTDEEARTAVVRAAGQAFELELVDVTPWTRRELVADAYRRGPVFLCGDACHIMSPTGGFGMNTGIADAVDLGWKLDAVLTGWGGAGLLDSYEHERRPVALRNVAEASANLRRMTQTGPGAQDARQAGRELASSMAAEWRTIGIHLGYRYDASPVISPDGTPAPEDSVATYAPTARPGSRAPHVWLGDGRSTLDLFGQGFVLLLLGRDPPDTEPMIRAAAKRLMPLTVVALDEPAVCAAYQRRCVLVRPDGHVAWRGDALPDRPGDLLDRVRGAPSALSSTASEREDLHAQRS